MTFDTNEHGTPDASLRDEFGALREVVENSGSVPDFDEMMERARAEVRAGDAPIELSTRRVRTPWTHAGAWMTAAMAAAAAGLLLIGPGRDSADADFERLVASYSADAALGAWRSPTADLLRTPGVDLGALPSVARVVPSSRPNLDEGRDS